MPIVSSQKKVVPAGPALKPLGTKSLRPINPQQVKRFTAPSPRVAPSPRALQTPLRQRQIASPFRNLSPPAPEQKKPIPESPKPEEGPIPEKSDEKRKKQDAAVQPNVSCFRGSTSVLIGLGTIETTRTIQAHMDIIRYADWEMYKVFIGLEERINPTGAEVKDGTFHVQFQETIDTILTRIGQQVANTTAYNSLGYVGVYNKDQSGTTHKLAVQTLAGSGPIPGGNITLPGITAPAKNQLIARVSLQIYFRRDAHVLTIDSAINFSGTLIVSSNLSTFNPPISQEETSLSVDGTNVNTFCYEKTGVITAEISGQPSTISLLARGQCANAIVNNLSEETTSFTII